MQFGFAHRTQGTRGCALEELFCNSSRMQFRTSSRMIDSLSELLRQPPGSAILKARARPSQHALR